MSFTRNNSNSASSTFHKPFSSQNTGNSSHVDMDSAFPRVKSYEKNAQLNPKTSNQHSPRFTSSTKKVLQQIIEPYKPQHKETIKHQEPKSEKQDRDFFPVNSNKKKGNSHDQEKRHQKVELNELTKELENGQYKIQPDFDLYESNDASQNYSRINFRR